MTLLELLELNPVEQDVHLPIFAELEQKLGSIEFQENLEFEEFARPILTNPDYRPSLFGDMSFTSYLYSREALEQFIARMDNAKDGIRDKGDDLASYDTRTSC